MLRELLGEGGFGAVYRAEQQLLGREAAVKVLKTRRTSESAPAARFLREAQLASRLDREMADLERQRLIDALARHAGNQTATAKTLGISRRTLVNRMREYRIPRPQSPD